MNLESTDETPSGVASEGAEPGRKRSTKRWIYLGVAGLLVLGLVVRYVSRDDSQNSGGSSAAEVDANGDPISAALQLLSSGKPSEAIKVLEDYVSANPKNELALFNLGSIYQIQLNDDVTAIAYYTKALDVGPKNTSALYNRAFAYWDRGELQSAANDFQKVVDLKKRKAPNALWNLGKVTSLLGDPVLGVQYMKEAQKLDPSLK